MERGEELSPLPKSESFFVLVGAAVAISMVDDVVVVVDDVGVIDVVDDGLTTEGVSRVARVVVDRGDAVAVVGVAPVVDVGVGVGVVVGVAPVVDVIAVVGVGVVVGVAPVVPVTTVLKVCPAQVPETAAQVEPASVDLIAENVGAGETSVVAGEEHFQPIVPPALPVTTT